MKKNIAILYRLAFVLFSIWAILESAAFNFAALPVKLLNFTVFSDTICLICILIVFIYTLRHKMGQALYMIKTGCTALALLALAANLGLFFNVSNGGWILKILLPLMMLLDHAIFDDNRKQKIWHMFLWLLAALFIAWLLYVIADKFLNLPNSLNLLGLFSNLNELANLLLNALIISCVAYLLERLFTGELFKDIQSMFSLFFRALFLILEAWAFIRISGMNLSVFLNAIRYYEILINFLCFLCIAAVLIYNTIYRKASAKSTHVLTRIKCFFTVGILLAFVLYQFCLKGGYKPDAVSVILYYIAPFMMLLDWLMFDSHCALRGYDPLIWTAVPVCYFIFTVLLASAGGTTLYPILSGLSAFTYLGVFTVVLLLIGYIFYIIDRFIKGR